MMGRGDTRNGAGEQAAAMLLAIFLMLVVAGIVTAFAISLQGEVRQGRNSRDRISSEGWLGAAQQDVGFKLQHMQVSPTTLVTPSPLSSADAARYELWTVPRTGAAGYDAGSDSFRISSTIAGAPSTGSYRVLPPVPGAPPWTVARVIDPADPAAQGSVRVKLQGWNDTNQARTETADVTYRRATFSRFSMLADEALTFGGLGSAALDGAIHSNNVRGDAVGVGWSGASLGPGAERVSSTRGAVTPSCSICHSNTSKEISFGAIDTAFNQLVAISKAGGCTGAPGAMVGVACIESRPMNFAPDNYAPAYKLFLGQNAALPAGYVPAGCVAYHRLGYRVSLDSGTKVTIDDRLGGTPYDDIGWSGYSTWCPPAGGGAIMFEGDVEVQGQRPAGAPPVTIMARKGATAPTVQLCPDPSSCFAVQDTSPASIYVTQVMGTNSVGSPDPTRPVGLVAEGGFRIPTYALANPWADDMHMENVAIAAKEGELSLGPATLAIASDGGTGAGGGLEPCAAVAEGFPSANRFRLTGSMATRREPALTYGTAACRVGYANREYHYAPRLHWDAPPLFPADQPWHVSEVQADA